MSATADDPVAASEPADPFVAPPRLTWPQRLGRVLVVAAFCATAFAGAVVGLRSRERDDAFVQHQLHPAVVARADVEKAVWRKTRIAATCAPGSGALRNTWDCNFRRGGKLRFVGVTVDPNGAFSGTGYRRFRGCCIAVPVP